MGRPESHKSDLADRIDDPRLRRHEFGFLEVVDKPSPDELKAYYHERYYQTEQSNYRKQYPEDELRSLDLKIAQKAAIVADIRGTDAPGSMLDVGCGEGFALAWFQKRGWQVEGIDYSRAGLESFHPDPLPRLEVGDMLSLLDERIAQRKRYDLVWLNNVLEHSLEPIALLTALRKLVADDGVLVVTVPNDGSGYQEMLLDNGDIPDRFWIAIPDHISYFTYDSLQDTAAATGWSCREIIGDFPIDLFLLHEGSNYVRDRAKGPGAHKARIRAELLIGERDGRDVRDFYSALARIGLGRNLTAFLTQKI